MRRRAHRAAIAAALISTPGLAMADIDMDRLSYHYEWTLFNSDRGQLVDNYNGSSQATGMFGYGWCAGFHLPGQEGEGIRHVVLEQTLKLVDDHVTVQHCGMNDRNGFLNVYEPDEGTRQRLQGRPLQAVLTAMGPDDPALVLHNTHPRLHTQAMVYQNGTWHWEDTARAAVKVTFDAQGRLLGFATNTVLRDDQGRLAAILQGDTHVVDFIYDTTGRVTTFKTGEGLEGGFEYNDRGWVNSVRTAWNRTYEFSYNEHGLLTGTRYPDQTSLSIFYDSKTGKVSSFIDRQGEMESYTVIQASPAFKKVLLKRTKDGKKMYDKTFAYQYNAEGLPVTETITKRDDRGEWVEAQNIFFKP